MSNTATTTNPEQDFNKLCEAIEQGMPFDESKLKQFLNGLNSFALVEIKKGAVIHSECRNTKLIIIDHDNPSVIDDDRRISHYFLFGEEAVNAYHMCEDFEDVCTVLKHDETWSVFEYEPKKHTLSDLVTASEGYRANVELTYHQYTKLKAIQARQRR